MKRALRRYVSLWPGGRNPTRVDLVLTALLTLFIGFFIFALIAATEGRVLVPILIGLVPTYLLYLLFKWAMKEDNS